MKTKRALLTSGVVVALVLTFGLSSAPSARAEVPPATFTDLGPLPLEALTAPGSAVGHGQNGEPYLYLVSSGTVAVFSVVDVFTGDRVAEFAMPGAGGSWAVEVAPNGDVYIGSYGRGELFRYTPGADRIEALGQPVTTETFLYSIDTAADGTVFGGTGQRDGHVFSYDPRTGQFTDHGSQRQGNDPVILRALATTPDASTVYALGAAVPFLVKVDTATNESVRLPLPEGYDPAAGGYDLDLRGDLLFARFSKGGEPTSLHIMDISTERWIDEITSVHGLTMSETAADGKTVYFVKENTLWSYDLSTRTATPTVVKELSDQRAFGFVNLGTAEWPGETLIGMNHVGKYFKYSPATGKLEWEFADGVKAPAPIRSMTEGPDGKVYAGSYLSGGLASFDPETGEKLAFAPEIGQAEGMTTHDGALYIGTYTAASVYRYDPDQPAVRGVNPKLVVRLDEPYGQSRPFAMTSAGPFLAVGTVPKNGQRGGGFTLIDTETSEHEFFAPVEGHSVIGLTYFDGVLYGTTSIFSGVGGPRPTEKDGYVFAFDVDARELLWAVAAVPGEGTFGELAFDKDGTLWTHGPVTAVQLDPQTGGVLRHRVYAPYPWGTIDYAYTGSKLWVDPWLDTIGSVSEAAYWVIDPRTMDRARHVRPVSFGFMHNSGTSYLGRNESFYSHRFNDDRTMPTVEVAQPSVERGKEQTLLLSDFAPGELVDIWLRPNATHLATVAVGDDGTLQLPFIAEVGAGEARVTVTRALTRGQMAVEFTVTHQANRPSHSYDKGRPAHADETGPPAHSKGKGKPAG